MESLTIGISQRDTNFYDHLQDAEERQKLTETVRAFFEDEVRDNYAGRPDCESELPFEGRSQDLVRVSSHCYIELTPDVLDLYCHGDKVYVVDFGPYRQVTDSLLFTYEELRDILETAVAPVPSEEGAAPTASGEAAADGASGTVTTADSRPRLPILRVIDHPAHPAANRNAPTYQTNMVPVEMVEMSAGRTADEFRQAWNEAIEAGFADANEEMPSL